MSSVKTTDNICRTCMSTDGELISLFSGASDNARLTNKIMNISDVTINERDGLPYMICRKCIFLVESFDCFKKQIESANKRMKNVWYGENDESPVCELKTREKNENCDEEEDDDDSLYEIQYISDEVKREVEDAFRRKHENTASNKIDENSRTLKNFRDVVLVPIEDIIGEKEDTSNRDAKSANFATEESSRGGREEKNLETGVSGHSLSQLTEDIEKKELEYKEKNSLRFEQPTCVEENIIDNENLDGVLSENLQSPNSDCDERLIIETEETDVYAGKILEPEYVEWEENLESERIKDTERRRIFEPDYRDRKENFDSEKINDNVEKSLDPLNLDRDNLREIFRPGKTENMEKKIPELRKLDCDSEKNIPEPEKLIDGVIKILEPAKYETIEKKILEPRVTDYNDERETAESKKIVNIEKNIAEPVNLDNRSGDKNFKTEKSDSIEKNSTRPGNLVITNEEENFATQKSDSMDKNILPSRESHCANGEEATTSENSLNIAKESPEMKKFDNNEKEPMDTEIRDNIGENNFYPEFNDSGTIVQNPETKKIADSEKNLFHLDVNSVKEIGNDEKMKIVEKKCHEKKFVDSGNFGENGKTMISNGKTLVIAENCTSDKKKRFDDVIVISSDSSDEERRKNYIETAKQRVATLSRRGRRKCLNFSRPLARRNGGSNVPSLAEKKITKEVAKNQGETGLKKIQARKYFQCTSCNISLYSVSAVLYHHNQIHTPTQELLSCQMCDVKFSTKHVLYAHFDRHVEAHLFRCSYCTCEFVLKRNLRTHMSAHARPKIDEPESKRPRIGEPSENMEIPLINDDPVVARDNEISGRVDKIEADKSMINQEGDG